MKYIYPDYYTDFHCVADKCRHSCCRGWEIDIDDDSLESFMSVGGELGEKLRNNISDNPAPHFILDAAERCPFLKEDGLCELILELGEDSLCEICAEHPRFYNEVPGRVEYGAGACCEEAARLIVSGKEPVRLIVEDDGDGESEEPTEMISLRDELLSVLNGPGSFKERTDALLSLVGEKPFDFSPARAAEFLLGLERMDESWTELLTDMRKLRSVKEIYSRLEDISYTRIAHYFIFRHLITAEDRRQAAGLLVFALVSTMTVCALDCMGYSEDALRLYSAELEYSDENLELVLEAIDDGRLFEE